MERTAKAQLSSALSLSFCDLIHPYPRQQLLTRNLFLHILSASLTCRPPPCLKLLPGHVLSMKLRGVFSVRPVPAGIDLVVFREVLPQVIVTPYVFIKEYFWSDLFTGPAAQIGPVAELPSTLSLRTKYRPQSLHRLTYCPFFSISLNSKKSIPSRNSMR